MVWREKAWKILTSTRKNDGSCRASRDENLPGLLTSEFQPWLWRGRKPRGSGKCICFQLPSFVRDRPAPGRFPPREAPALAHGERKQVERTDEDNCILHCYLVTFCKTMEDPFLTDPQSL